MISQHDMCTWIFRTQDKLRDLEQACSIVAGEANLPACALKAGTAVA